ncbi:hypothetical protein SNE40_022974 [Patella caerulea]|uniref:DUF4773 domain-containing protein n=1 Tax=Patella caerulea TaxID=87958 RepID=A0AAN8GBK2_PATCE
MAMCKWLYRRKRSVFLLLIASTAWIAYLTFATESNSERKNVNKVTDNSISHKYFNQDYIVEPPGAQQQDDNSNDTEGKESPKKTKDDDTHLEKIIQMGEKIKNKTVEMGESFKNKTIAVGKHVKNKTLEHLAVLGMLRPKNKIKYLYYPSQFNLSVDLEDIGNIMKDTEFLNKLHPLDLSGPALASTQNRTINYTYNMKYHVGFCDCWDRNCLCCARIINKRLHLNRTMCSNFTFISKTHELETDVLLDGKIIHKRTISADEPPLLCLGSFSKVVDICVHFFNVTFKVNAETDHKTQLLGCTDFSLNLYNKTIGAHPVDCFQIPGDPNKKHKDRPFNLFGNWMP